MHSANRIRNLRATIILIILCSTALLAAQTPTTQSAAHQSAITIHVGKSGLFSAAAHNHIIVTPIARANVDPAHLSAEITVLVKDMKVTDPEVSDKDRAEIQSTMLGPKVLDQEKYPEIHFKSVHIEQTSPQHYRVAGTLELHGAKQEVTLEVISSPAAAASAEHGTAQAHYHGTAKLKQSDYGIKPISLFGGSVKVKDELELEFDVYAFAPEQGK
jgi:polyisoprenoid-binding protein YceI